jgi:hypothetical protein
LIIKKDSELHKILRIVQNSRATGPGDGERNSLAQLVRLGWVTGGQDNQLTAEGKRALKRIEADGEVGTGLAGR